MAGMLPFIRNYFWPSAVKGRKTNGVTHSVSLQLTTSDERGRPGVLIRFLTEDTAVVEAGQRLVMAFVTLS